MGVGIAALCFAGLARHRWLLANTRKGQTLFEEIFPAHVAHLAPVFTNFTDADLDGMCLRLNRLGAAFDSVNAKPDKTR